MSGIINNLVNNNLNIPNTLTIKPLDKLEIGTSKSGLISIHGDFSNPDEFQAKIDNALKLRKYAQSEGSFLWSMR